MNAVWGLYFPFVHPFVPPFSLFSRQKKQKNAKTIRTHYFRFSLLKAHYFRFFGPICFALFFLHRFFRSIFVAFLSPFALHYFCICFAFLHCLPIFGPIVFALLDPLCFALKSQFRLFGQPTRSSCKGRHNPKGSMHRAAPDSAGIGFRQAFRQYRGLNNWKRVWGYIIL